MPQRDANGKIIVGANGQPVMTPNDVSPRWVGSGWTVFNNKGKPVRQYEPFFTDTHRFEFDVRIGVSPVLFYDPVERVVATLHPNHTWEKVVFDPWRQETWDVNDTVLIADPKTDPTSAILPPPAGCRLPADLARPARMTDRARRRRNETPPSKAAVHADTPTWPTSTPGPHLPHHRPQPIQVQRTRGRSADGRVLPPRASCSTSKATSAK